MDEWAAMNGGTVDTKLCKTPDPLPFAAWRALGADDAVAEIRNRIGRLSPEHRRAAIAWLPREDELRDELASARRDAPLRGVPFFAKDLFDVVGAPTTAGSAFLASVRPVPRTSHLVQQLRDHGAALAGKAQMVEFAAGLTGENRTYGDCPHPRDATRLSGGSSSGSASLVGAGVTPLALGSDTGGSVRVPAAFCGVYGFRLTPQDAFVRDAFPLSQTCDTAGWFTSNLGDLRAVLDLIAGPAREFSRPLRGCFLAAKDVHSAAQDDVDRACSEASSEYASHADTATREALLSSWTKAIDAYTSIVMYEAHAVHREWLEPHREHYDPSIWQRIVNGGQQPEETVEAARHEVARVRAAFASFFESYDFLIMPCAPMPALKKSEATPEARKAILTFTTPASLAGLPVLTIPVALPSGLTAGIQIIAPRVDSPSFRM
jgi:Asp-tRNA(Asn)/Glu-tRNA(Gln) amidotransferase A subunit family amidase